jgi:hypothetical protein
VGRDAECVRACKFGEQFGELASDGPVGANVRSGAQMCGERAAECVREYPTSLVRYSIRYGLHVTSKHRAPASAPPSSCRQLVPARQSWLPDPQTGTFGTSRLSHPCKLLRLSGLAIT